jgi:RHS repeat-associated protein
VNYQYDANGNTLSALTETLTTGSGTPSLSLGSDGGYELYTYNGFNQLVSTIQDSVETTYVYKPDGLRYNKATNGTTTTHIWDGANIAAELTGSTVTTYVRGINLITKGGGSQYYSFNAHGDVVQLTNSSGTVTKNYRYDAFGVEVDPQGTDTNPWRYCGEYWDRETGTVYLRARYYDPIIGRFLSEDTHWNPQNMILGDNPKDPLGLNIYMPDRNAIIQSGNLYAYCMNNPLMWQDPSGASIILTCIIIGAIIGVVAGATYGNYKANQAGYTIQSGGWDYWKYPIGYGTIGAASGALVGWGIGAGYVALTASSPWWLDQFTRGNAIEKMLGGMGNNFPVIDKFVKGANNIAQSITSIKSIDLLANSYQAKNAVYNLVMKYGNSLANFSDTTWNNIVVKVGPGTQRILELAVPPGATQSQIDQIYKAASELIKQSIVTVVKVIN